MFSEQFFQEQSLHGVLMKHPSVTPSMSCVIPTLHFMNTGLSSLQIFTYMNVIDTFNCGDMETIF